MTSYTTARAAYARPEGPARTLRSIEYDLLARTTQRLGSGWAARTSNFAGLIEALDDNFRLWLTLATDVANPENGLPSDLRARLFYLYEFTAEHTRRVRAGEAGIEALVDINTAVMRGLRGNGGAA